MVQEVGALVTACAALRRDRYLEVGGMDEEFPVSCNDVDLCLRLRAQGLSVLWTPFAELYHHESASWSGLRPVATSASSGRCSTIPMTRFSTPV